MSFFYLVSISNVSSLQNKQLKANKNSFKIELSVILNPAVERILVSKEICSPIFVSCLNWKCNLSGPFCFFPIMNKIFSLTSGCFTLPLFFVIFIQVVEGVWLSTNVCVATLLLWYCWTELPVNEIDTPVGV